MAKKEARTSEGLQEGSAGPLVLVAGICSRAGYRKMPALAAAAGGSWCGACWPREASGHRHLHIYAAAHRAR